MSIWLIISTSLDISGSYLGYGCLIRESPPQFENRIMARVYVRSITRSTMYQKAPFCLAGTDILNISSKAFGFSFISIDYSDYPKSLISKINEVYVFFSKISL